MSNLLNSLNLIVNGGKGSGNFDHEGRPGLVGGSAGEGSSSSGSSKGESKSKGKTSEGKSGKSGKKKEMTDDDKNTLKYAKGKSTSLMVAGEGEDEEWETAYDDFGDEVEEASQKVSDAGEKANKVLEKVEKGTATKEEYESALKDLRAAKSECVGYDLGHTADIIDELIDNMGDFSQIHLGVNICPIY